MAHLDAIETRPEATSGVDLEALFWWRRDNETDSTAAVTPLVERLNSLQDRAERLVPVLPRGEPPLPGNSMRAKAARYRIIGAVPQAETAANDRVEPEMREAIRSERRSATLTVGMGTLATLLATGAAIHAAEMRETLAMSFAMAGMLATSFALYHAARWLMLMRSSAVPKFI